MPLVLVQNEVIVNQGYDWEDIPGEQYHFPNQYKNRCIEGTPFIYYRGVRRESGLRGNAEYFGYGHIGELWRDASVPETQPKRKWNWYCRIVDYVPFSAPVPAKIDGEFLERIARNHWSVGVRPLPEDVFTRILQMAGCANLPAQQSTEILRFPDLSSLTITEANSPLLAPQTPNRVKESGGTSGGRYSRNAAPVGRRAEEIVLRYISERAASIGARKIRWVARDGITPGWDIQYEDLKGDLIAVEVKGTAGPMFANVDITAGEWKAAETHGDRYWLYLVADCCGNSPRIQCLQNPAQIVKTAAAQLVPVVFRLSALVV